MIDQARQVGANLVTYLLGTFQLGRFLSTTKHYYEQEIPSRDDFVFAQLKHEGDWDPDPSAVHNLLKFARENSTLEVKFKRANVRLDDPKAAAFPLLYITGHHDFVWSKQEASLLGRYLQAGGMLLADACCGRLAFDAALRRELARALPDAKLEPIPADHPIYHCLFDIEREEYTPRVARFRRTRRAALREFRSTPAASSIAASTGHGGTNSPRTATDAGSSPFNRANILAYP